MAIQALDCGHFEQASTATALLARIVSSPMTQLTLDHFFEAQTYVQINFNKYLTVKFVL